MLTLLINMFRLNATNNFFFQLYVESLHILEGFPSFVYSNFQQKVTFATAPFCNLSNAGLYADLSFNSIVQCTLTE